MRTKSWWYFYCIEKVFKNLTYLGWLRLKYSSWDTSIHLEWCHKSHSLHWIACWLIRQHLSQIAQGCLTGPGFILASPTSKIKQPAHMDVFIIWIDARSLQSGGRLALCCLCHHVVTDCRITSWVRSNIQFRWIFIIIKGSNQYESKKKTNKKGTGDKTIRHLVLLKPSAILSFFLQLHFFLVVHVLLDLSPLSLLRVIMLAIFSDGLRGRLTGWSNGAPA